MTPQTHLLLIDPQNDFCDLPATYLPFATDGKHLQPALPVPGAHADMLRLANLIRHGATGIDGISVTLDSHHRLDIAHPTFWRKSDGGDVSPFTEISAAEARAGHYLPRRTEALPRALTYLDQLEQAGRYRLMVWPVHCEIGSWGHNVHRDVHDAYNRWEDSGVRCVDKISKGSNPWTEHYSAVMAEVPDPADPATQLNRHLIEQLARNDRIYIAGEAGSHCVRATTEHIVDHLPPGQAGKLVLITDCISPVSGFEQQYQDFLRAMQARGVRLADSTAVLSELLAR